MQYLFGPFCLDTQTAQLSGPEGDIALRPMALKLLCFLVEHAQRVLSHEELLDAVWGRQEVTLGVLSQSVRELRRALGDTAQESRYIETKHKLGYRFIAPVQTRSEAQVEADPPPPARATRPTDAAPVATGSRRASSGIWWKAALLALLATGVVAWMQLGGFGQTGSADALRAYEVLHQGQPQEPEAREWYRNGLASLRERNLAEARAWLDKSLQREPTSAAAMAAMADVLAQAGERIEAKRWADAAIAEAGALAQVEQLRLAAFTAALDYQQDEAIAKLQSVHQLNPGDADAGVRLAESLIRAGRGDEAGALLGRIETLPSASHLASRIAMTLARGASARGDHAARLQAAIAAEKAAGSEHDRIDALLEQAGAYLLLGDRDAAVARLDAARSQLDQTPWPAARITQQLLEATLSREAGELERSMQQFEQAAHAARQLGLLAAAAAAEREAAFVQSQQGDHAAALQRLQSLREQQAQLGDPRALASTLDVSAIVAQRAGDIAAAQGFSTAALSAYTETGDQAGEASARSNLGMLFARTGRAADAEPQLLQALQLFQLLGDRRGAAVAQSNLAIIYARDGRIDSSREANEAALQAFRDVGATLDVARLQFNLGIQDRGAGRLEQTETRFREALDGFTRIGAGDVRLQVLASLSELMLARADPAAAEALLRDVDRTLQLSPQRGAALATARGRLAALRGEFETARSELNEALRLRSEANLTDWALMSELELAELAAREGRLPEAEQSARELRRAMLAGKDAYAAFGAGILLAGTLAAQNNTGAAQAMFDELETELLQVKDAMLGLRLDLLRAATREDARAPALTRVAQRARAAGFELLALRAELLAGGSSGELARTRLTQLGIAIEGMPPPLPY